MKLIVTIDTEEDNWNRYSATDNPVENIQRIPALQKLFDEFNVLPTYLITYPVATNPKSVAILKRILEDGKCEIGMHCHPWNTPPFNGNDVIRKQDTMLCNIPEEVQRQKLEYFHETIIRNFGITPVSFRAGRWGLGLSTVRILSQLGYKVDTSVTPYVSWKNSFGPDYSDFGPEIFRFNCCNLSSKNNENGLLEVPVTIGFLQSNFKRCQRLTRSLEKTFKGKLHLPGILERMGLLNKVWLSPEFADTSMMIKLAQSIRKNNYSCLNMTFHSSSLLGGLNNFVGDGEENTFLKRIKKFLLFVHQEDLESQTLTKFAECTEPYIKKSYKNVIQSTEKNTTKLKQLNKAILRQIKLKTKRTITNIFETAAYRISRPKSVKNNICNIIFVCQGNICRSAFAEFYMKNMLINGNYRFESCGLETADGSISPQDAVKIGQEFDLNLEIHRSKEVFSCDLSGADLIIPMEYKHYVRILRLFPEHKHKIRLLMDFAPWPDRLFCNIFDPYGLGEEEYRRTFKRIKRALDGLIIYLSVSNRFNSKASLQ